jgi:chromosome partitioning protein
MEVLVFASRKGGSGKSTLSAHLAAHAHKPSRRCLLIDTDPQGSLTLWHRLRVEGGAADDLPIKTVHRNIAEVVKEARHDRFDWVFVDTAPNMSASVTDAMRTATLVLIPCRPGVFDLDAVKDTVGFAREVRKPYAVVVNAAPPKRQDAEAPAVTLARAEFAKLHIPVWGSQITQRANFSAALAEGEGAKEFDSNSSAAAEIARLWLAIEKSVKAIRGAAQGGMHRAAA